MKSQDQPWVWLGSRFEGLPSQRVGISALEVFAAPIRARDWRCTGFVVSRQTIKGSSRAQPELPCTRGAGARLLDTISPVMPIVAGQTLSYYEILGPLGAGGMGEVYRARDTRLGREVAIKVLPERLAQDEERLRRFEREAKTLASLNHPNVAGIHGVDQEGDLCFLALELVPGEDLGVVLARGPLPVNEAIDVCRQIAEGLEAAHEAGVVHRDLKPANVRITPEGVVKILDFGLAKPIIPKANKEGTTTAESDSFLMTEEGLVLGTPTYMSPEQARGKPVDRRTDIWAFGCVLYECLTGQRAFGGESFTDVVAAIVGAEPDESRLPKLPPHVTALLRRCLTKNPRSRLRDIGEARLQLERGSELANASSEEVAPSRNRIGPIALLGVALGVVLGVVAAWMAMSDGQGERLRDPRTLVLAIPGSTDQYERLDNPLLSPDGKWVAFRAQARFEGTTSFWVRRLDSYEAVPLPGTERATRVFWSPDSSSIGFELEDTLTLMQLDGQNVRRLTIGAAATFSWSSSGWIVYGAGEGPLWKIRETGGEPVPLTELDSDSGEMQHNAPTFLPDGDRFLFVAPMFQTDAGPPKHRLYAGSLSGKAPTTLVTEMASKPWYTNRGELVYIDNGRIMTVPFDEETMRITGAPKALADRAQWFRPLGLSSLSVSRDGIIAYEKWEEGDVLEWVDRRGLKLGRVGEPGLFTARISPDGRSVALAIGDMRTNLTDIWVRGLERETLLQLSNHPGFEGQPVWSRDGRSIFYMSDARGYPDIERLDLDSPGEPTLVWDADGAQFPLDVTANGEGLLVRGSDGFWLLSTDGSQEPRKFELIEDDAISVRLSAGRNRAAYFKIVRGEFQVFVQELDGDQRRVQISVDGGWDPTWGPNGDVLYYSRADKEVWEVDLSTEDAFTNPEPHILFQTAREIDSFEVAPDGERFLMNFLSFESRPATILLRD